VVNTATLRKRGESPPADDELRLGHGPERFARRERRAQCDGPLPGQARAPSAREPRKDRHYGLGSPLEQVGPVSQHDAADEILGLIGGCERDSRGNMR
jgi:hypothetical protein